MGKKRIRTHSRLRPARTTKASLIRRGHPRIGLPGGKGASEFARIVAFLSILIRPGGFPAPDGIVRLRALTRLLYLERDALADSVEESRKGRSLSMGSGLNEKTGSWPAMWRVALLLAAICLGGTRLLAQSSTASLAGRVTDPSKA